MKMTKYLTLFISSLFLTNIAHAQQSTYCSGPVMIMDSFGEVETVPDIAEIVLNVKSQNETEPLTLENLSKNMQRIIDVLHEINIEDKNITTRSINLNPVRDPQNRQSIIAYAGSSEIYFKTYQLDNITELMGKVMEGSNSLFSRISYSTTKENELKNEARAKAFENVSNKSKLYAQISGKELGDICTLTEGNINVVSNQYRANISTTNIVSEIMDSLNSSGFTDASANVERLIPETIPIQPGQIKISAHVSIVYQLKN